MKREELYKSAKSILHEDFCLNGKCSYYDKCERGEGNVPPRKNSCNYDFALSMMIRGIDLAVDNLPSPWINVNDDLPCNHEGLIRGTEISEGTKTFKVFVTNVYGENWSDYMIYKNGKWRWNSYEPDYWMSAPKLPK